MMKKIVVKLLEDKKGNQALSFKIPLTNDTSDKHQLVMMQKLLTRVIDKLEEKERLRNPPPPLPDWVNTATLVQMILMPNEDVKEA